jgi:hypothetical protein
MYSGFIFLKMPYSFTNRWKKTSMERQNPFYFSPGQNMAAPVIVLAYGTVVKRTNHHGSLARRRAP